MAYEWCFTLFLLLKFNFNFKFWVKMNDDNLSRWIYDITLSHIPWYFWNWTISGNIVLFAACGHRKWTLQTRSIHHKIQQVWKVYIFCFPLLYVLLLLLYVILFFHHPLTCVWMTRVQENVISCHFLDYCAFLWRKGRDSVDWHSAGFLWHADWKKNSTKKRQGRRFLPWIHRGIRVAIHDAKLGLRPKALYVDK